MISTLSAEPSIEYVLVPRKPTQAMLDACGPKPRDWNRTPTSKLVREECDKMRRDDYCTMIEAFLALKDVAETRHHDSAGSSPPAVFPDQTSSLEER